MREDAARPHGDGIDAGPLPPKGRSWGARLQHVPLRTKVLVPMVALPFLSVMAIGLLTISQMRVALRQQVIQQIEFDTAVKADALEEFLQNLHKDLRFLSETRAIRSLAGTVTSVDQRRALDLRRMAEQELALFSQGRPGYDQLRYLDDRAREILRLESVPGSPRLVPVEPARQESDSYYLQNALTMEPGRIYVSEFMLNVEDGRDGSAPQRELRCATPVGWEQGERPGLLVMNVDGAYFGSLVGPLPAGVEAWLVNDDGYYLNYFGDSNQKRETYAMSRMRPIEADLGPRDAVRILEARTGPAALEIGGSLLSVAPVAFDAEAGEKRWTFLMAQPLAPVYAPVGRMTQLLSVVLGLVALLAAATGVLIAHYVARPLAALRRATIEIAGGDLSKRVSVSTGDEIEGLAIDFNTMTDRLREAQERLSAWNETLRREVARQTDRLHRLQAGLARADKLASIGQMTASVLHEIGNPLAAIKAKIQVAEEGERITEESRVLLDGIVHEVDRLTVVLRSYSRLGRLHEPRFETVPLEEVVRSVVDLVTPELKREGVSLRVSAAGDVPAVRADPDQLRQLLINFILNAADASPEGAEIVVRAGPSRDGPRDWAHIEIEDHGAGIAAEDMDRIWDPLFTTKAEGTGLGLAICRTIVDDHEGTLEVRSRPGEGTLIRVSFPAADGAS